ncbi:hypothetical protein C0993_004563 [Termitomyces sp. T159_Od127]|nr:hypothetical protein C0993_004563 [Termitomyces sp. T159_Od127]
MHFVIEVLVANGIAPIVRSMTKRKSPHHPRNLEIIDLSEDVEGNENKRVKVEVKAEVKDEVKPEWIKAET